MPKGIFVRTAAHNKANSLARLGKKRPEIFCIKMKEIALRIRPKGRNHPMWKEEGSNYRNSHRWIKNTYGKPAYCEKCKRTDKKRYEWASKDHKYSKDIKDWMRVCTSCHRKHDYEVFGRSEKLLNYQKTRRRCI